MKTTPIYDQFCLDIWRSQLGCFTVFGYWAPLLYSRSSFEIRYVCIFSCCRSRSIGYFKGKTKRLKPFTKRSGGFYDRKLEWSCISLFQAGKNDKLHVWIQNWIICFIFETNNVQDITVSFCMRLFTISLILPLLSPWIHSFAFFSFF